MADQLTPLASPDTAQVPVEPNDAVTLVIHHKVRRGEQQRYEAWLKRTVKAARAQPGHLGVNVIRPAADSQVFTSVLRFASVQQLQTWIDSAERHALVEEVLPLLDGGDHPLVHSDPEFWFTPANGAGKQPPRWKQAVVSYAVILPLSILVPMLWHPVFLRYPVLGGMLPSNMLITACIVVSVILIMPNVTRWLAGWLTAD
ncbi:antibiotic biosynthesis monooxygenase [Pseudomonas sp. RIT-PI-S]|uniref:antibiotic biosynthesis monooxygenase n=1 Tax=Pseudomonas sp. RIT-PI-S TaxID=3035295 RepID=UPI0021DB1522|nr:antibiotic biosynthesis monooxygenase [Pseudomonas sp. RIT-PI-S]